MAAYLAFGASVLVGGLSGISGKKSAKAARKREVARIRTQTAEEIRRRTGSFERDKSGAVALAGASGFGTGDFGQETGSGGFGQVLKDMQTEFGLEVDWLKRSAEAGIDVTNQAYKSTASAINYNYAGSLVSSFNVLGQAKNWWV